LRSFAATWKEAGLSCGSFLLKGEVFAFVELVQTIKDLTGIRIKDENCGGFPYESDLDLTFTHSTFYPGIWGIRGLSSCVHSPPVSPTRLDFA